MTALAVLPGSRTTGQEKDEMAMMQRAQYDRYGPPEVLYVGEVAVPEPGPGEILVQVHAASVNGGELMGRSGKLRLLTRGPFPRGTGVDFAGQVVEINGTTTGVARGDWVWGVLPDRDRVSGGAGSVAEYVAVPADLVGHPPAGLDPVQAVALLAGGTTAMTGLRDEARLQPGERLLVRGASGGVGSIAVQLGRALGARVTGLASRQNLDLIRELGAEESFDYATVGPNDLGEFDVIFDTVGSQLLAYRRLLTPGGRMVTITPDANHLVRSVAVIAASPVFGSRRVRFFRGAPRRALFTKLAAYVDSGDLRPVIDTIYPLTGIAEAHRALEARSTRGKHIIQLCSCPSPPPTATLHASPRPTPSTPDDPTTST